MSVKSFKFVSPGVFINEIDNSFVPKIRRSHWPCGYWPFQARAWRCSL
jgi:hypothetical protein